MRGGGAGPGFVVAADAVRGLSMNLQSVKGL